MGQTDDLNADLQARLDDLAGILQQTLKIDDTIKFDSLRERPRVPPFKDLEDDTGCAPAMKVIEAPGFFAKLLPGAAARHAQAVAVAEIEAKEAQLEYAKRLRVFEARRAQHRAAYDRAKSDAQNRAKQRNAEVDAFEAAYRTGDVSAVVTYNMMVLERSSYPDGFPQEFRVTYLPGSRELVIEYRLPLAEVVPAASQFRYVKARDAHEETPRKPAHIRELYQDIVAAVTLRSIHEVFEADQAELLDVCVFNGIVDAIDPATGRDMTKCLVSVRATKASFIDIDLARVNKTVCLRNLGAQVSQRPDEMLAVKPIIEYDMADRRFVDQVNIIDGLDGRPNLMELDPFAFEQLVSNLFGKMGLDTRQTQSSRDGGVDAVAFDTRPIVGGKVVIQAKRYRNTVGVSAVRDLYGTLLNEGASKGILVSTSSYGPDAYTFAQDKPIELIDGGGLLYLLDQVGVRARIIMPTD